MTRSLLYCWLTAGSLICSVPGSVTTAADAAKKSPEIPHAILDGKSWIVADQKGNTPTIAERGGRSFVTAAARQLVIVTPDKMGPDQRVTIEFRLANTTGKGALALSTGLADAADLKARGLYVTIAPGTHGVAWSVHDPNAKSRELTTGQYRPQFHAERSLAWPEALRANVEADLVASQPIDQRVVELTFTLRHKSYEVALDGIPLTRVAHDSIDTHGFGRITLPPNIELLRATTEPAPPENPNWLYQPIALRSVLNASQINGESIDRAALQSGQGQFTLDNGVPFELPAPNAAGLDHVDIGASWFRQANLPGRYSGRGADPLSGRWGGALVKDPARISLRLPMARYRALHLLAATDNDADSVPVITAQFYRAQAGFPKNFSTQVPAFTATSVSQKLASLAVKTRSGKSGRLFHVTIPIEPGALAEFDDLDYIDVELTKQVQIYRASPDPMYYSYHAAGLPSGVHLFALTAERPAFEVSLTASAYAHVWTKPETPSYVVTIQNRRSVPQMVSLETAVRGAAEPNARKHVQSLTVPANQASTITLPLELRSFGYHTFDLAVSNGSQTWTESRAFAYLPEDTRERGNWDFGRGPLFGFWNWGGGHGTPAADKQLLVMAKAGIEATPGSFEEYTARHGDAAKAVMEKYKIFTLKFAGAGDHYVTARFAQELKTAGLEKARDGFVKTLTDRASQPGPNSRPLFLSYYPEPSIGPLTHGIFPHFIGEPETPLTDYERERYELFLNGFVEGAKIVKEKFPTVKNLLPHGDPAFVIHFLRRNPEVAKWLDGITVDIPCFERLPEQQFHQVSLHRLYMVRKELADAGIKKPLLPMYEGPCVPSGPGALTEQEQSDITIRNALLLLAYGVDIQNGGLPGFDCTSYWGEQHYGFGVLNRMSLETPKMAYVSLATMTRHLNRCNFAKWVPTGSENVYALQFKHYRTGKLVHVLWTLRGTRPVTLTLPQSVAPSSVTAFDQNDNPLPLVAANPGSVTFKVNASPCYVEGLTADAAISLGEADHSDSRPGSLAKRLANFGDGSWKIATRQEKEYEDSHKPYIFRFPSPMTIQKQDAPAAFGGKALAIHFPKPEKERVFVPHYSVLTPSKPITIPGKASHLGLWVRAAGDWGRAIYFVRDAKGEQWISVGTRGEWNCDDLHSWTSFNFDGWRYLKMEMPANSPYDKFREMGRTWWGAYGPGDGLVDLPLSLEKVVVERRTHVMYVDSPVPAKRDDVLFGDLFAEYAGADDETPAAARLAAITMPIPRDVPGLTNPIAQLTADGAAPPLAIQRITLPAQEVDGTQCHVHFPEVPGAKQYDLWVAPYSDGRGALNLGKAWKAPGQLVRGLRPNQPFYLFVTYTTADGKVSSPSAAFKIQLEDFFGMK